MFIITTPIPYTNGEPHLGHLLEAVFTDTIARFYRRVMTDEVLLTMGLDQHGLKIWEKAKELGLNVETYVDMEGRKFENLWEQFEITYNTFTKTSSPQHKAVAQIIWKQIAKKGLIYKKSYTGLYCKGCEDFYAPSQLVDGKCPIHHSELIEMTEENYFFRLSQFKPQIVEFLNNLDIKPEYIRKEWLNFVDDLQDTSVSREKSRLPWGIELPEDLDQVMYVWFEAVINYLTACVNPETIDRFYELNQSEEVAQEIMEEIRQALPLDLMYISKEIAKFHLVFFPAILLSLDLPLPKRVLAHGLVNDSQGRKFSKSLGNGVYPSELVERFGVDGARFVLLHEINVDGDTNFDWDQITQAYNSQLADKIGNLVMRVSNLAEKHLSEELDLSEQKPLVELGDVYENLHKLKVREALDEVIKAAEWGNKRLEDTKPWQMIKEGEVDKAQEILKQLCVLLREIGIVLSIFLPSSGSRIYEIFTQSKIVKSEVLFPKWIEKENIN